MPDLTEYEKGVIDGYEKGVEETRAKYGIDEPPCDHDYREIPTLGHPGCEETKECVKCYNRI